MDKPKVFNVYDLEPVRNVCNQTLREVISLPEVSMAHVTMQPKAESLLHKHEKLSEIYFILAGLGILYSGKNFSAVSKKDYHVLQPRTSHKLFNIGTEELEHLVFSHPKFDPGDVILLKDEGKDYESEKEKSRNPECIQHIIAQDGASIYELFTEDEKRDFKFGLAVGHLHAGKESIPHYHKETEEVYYALSGNGVASIDKEEHQIQKGSVVHIGVGEVHSLQNTSKGNLSVLCLSSPAYKDEDFFKD
mgnify:CR=1 FL=1